LTRYRDGRFTTFAKKNGLPDNNISALLEDHNGTLWIVAGGSLSRFEHGQFAKYSGDRLLPVQEPQSLFEDAHQTLWVSGVGGLVKLVEGNFVQVLGAREMNGQTGLTMTEDLNGGLWIGGRKGLLMRTPDGVLKRFDSRDGLPDNLVETVLADRDGNLWAGTNSGLSRLKQGRFIASDFEGGRNNDFVRCLFEAREGDLWVGMRSGLNRLRDDLFTVFSRAEGFPGDDPVAVDQDKSGTIWVGYHSNGLAAVRNGEIQRFTTKDGLASNNILAVREMRNGDLLIPTRAGLSWMHSGSFINYVLPDPGAATVILDALEDSQGRIWAVGPGGVYKMAAGKFSNVIPAGPLLNGPAVVLAAGLEGSIWVGVSGGGLRQIKNDKTTSFTTADGLGSDTIRSLYQDPDGTLWIGTLGGGLSALRDGAFTKYTVKDGLLSDNISHIDDDGQGFLWLSTHRGICRVAKRQLREFSSGLARTITPVNYGVEDGLRSSQVAPGYPTGGGGTRTSDGRLWFPTTKGLAVIETNAEKAYLLPGVAVEFSEVTVDGHGLDIRQPAKLNPGPRQIQFRYTALHLNNPEQVRYEYKLEGFDADWIPAANRRVVNYTNLRHGPYRFLVRTSVPGHYPSQGAFDLEVLPYFYEKQAFIWLVVASFLAAAYGIYRLLLWQIHLRFSLVLDERARMAREIHDTLSQGLVGISSQLNAVAGRIRVHDGVAEQQLELARKMVRHSLTEARRSMMDLRVPLLNECDLTSALATAANQWTAGTNLRVDVDVSGGRYQFPRDTEQNILRIVQEAVTNTVKHAGATRVDIHLQTEERRLVLTLDDDGCGFDSSGAFSMAEGHFGLLGMRERAERLGGEFYVTSEGGTGTNVRVTIPLPRDHTKKTSGGGLSGVFKMRPRAVRS
jgi:signal transduction histidine kinase/ligand-binding sensor domain-containing protein